MTDDEYKGLLGEIIDFDCYRMRKVDDVVSINDPTFVHWHGHARQFNFEPDYIFDLGANVGVFSRYCASLYPKAHIIAVEPDMSNYLQFNKLGVPDNVSLLRFAVGSGTVYRAAGALNGAHESYFTKSHAYPTLESSESMAPESSIATISLSELMDMVPAASKVVLKIDIEGNEATIFENTSEMQALRRADYIVFELHNCADNAELIVKMNQIKHDALKSLEVTHDCVRDHVYFYATKRV